MEGGLQNTLIYLVGFPGTGKYTIAQEIVNKADFRLIDNHLINNPVFSVIRLDGKTPISARAWDNTLKIWEAVADTIVHVSPPEYSFVLTNALIEGDAGDLQHYKRIEELAAQRRARFIPVRLLISDVEEHSRRITAPDRAVRFKENHPQSAAKYALSKGVLQVDHPQALTLDVTSLAAADAAEKILSYAASV
jgi:hypothetical protein